MAETKEMSGARLSEAATQETAEEFFRAGVALVRGVLPAEECIDLQARTDAIFDDPRKREASLHGNPLVISNPLLHDLKFRDLMRNFCFPFSRAGGQSLSRCCFKRR